MSKSKKQNTLNRFNNEESKYNSKTSKVLQMIWNDPNARPIPYDRKTMEDEVSLFTTDDVKQVYEKLKKKGGKKKKRITIKKKKARKSLKKPMFKRKSAKHK